MTCIVGLAHNGIAYIGGDSAMADSTTTTMITALPKVFATGPFLIGYTDSFRMGQILQHHLSVRPQDGESDMEYMVRGFIAAVRSGLKEHGYAKVESNQEEGGTFLVGYRGHVYEVNGDFQVNESADGLSAVGCGKPYALAAMQALAGREPIERIGRALEITAYYCAFVRPPFRILKRGAGL